MNTSRMKFAHEMIPNARHIILPRNCNEHVNLTINKHPSTDNNDIIRSVAQGTQHRYVIKTFEDFRARTGYLRYNLF